MITTFSTNLLPSPNLYYNSHYEKFADGTVKCIDDEIPFEIPSTWEWVRFKNLVQFSLGKTPERVDSSFWSPNDFPWVSIADMEDKTTLTKTKEFISQKALTEKFNNTFSPIGTLIMSFKLTIGKVSILGINAVHNEAIISIFPFINEDNITRDYLYNFLSIITRYTASTDAIKGATLNSKKISEMLVPLPPLNEQKRIAQRIEDIQPLIDKYRIAQEQAEEMDKSLNGLLKKSVLQYAIQGKLVPQNSNEEPASALLEKIQQEKLQLVKEGKLKKKDLDNSVIYKGDDNKYYEKLGSKTTEITEEIPYELPINWTFVRLSNLCWLDDGYKASGEKLPYLDAKYHRGKSEVTYLTQGKIVKPPCKAILVDGENSGEIFNITEKGYLGSTFKVLQISKCISEEWLHFLLDTYRDLFKNSKVGAAIPHLNKNLFRNLIVGLPPFEEQQRITDRIEKLTKGIEGI